jgi:hypothetical protein
MDDRASVKKQIPISNMAIFLFLFIFFFFFGTFVFVICDESGHPGVGFTVIGFFCFLLLTCLVALICDAVGVKVFLSLAFGITIIAGICFLLTKLKALANPEEARRQREAKLAEESSSSCDASNIALTPYLRRCKTINFTSSA